MDYKKMSYISGAVVFFGLLIVLISIMWLSSGNIFFSHNYSIFAKFREVTGLREQSPVFLRGYRIGVVKDVAFLKDGIVIRLNINKRFSIPEGSAFAVSTVNLIGEKGISISPIDTATTFMQSGDTVQGENKDMMIALQGLLSGLQKNIEGGDISRRITRLGESIDLMQSILGKLDIKLDQIDASEFNRQLAQVGEAGRQAQALIRSTQPKIQELTQEGKEALARLNQTCEEISNLAKSVKGVSDKIDHGDGTAAQLLNSRQTIDNLNAAITQLRKFLEDIQANPKRYIKLSLF